MPLEFPHTRVKVVDSWSNYSSTISGRPIPIYCTPEGGADSSILRKHGDAVRAMLRHCFTQTPPASIRALGSTWSFSRIVEPGQVALDPANFNYIERLPHNLFSAGYRDRAAQGFTPVFIEGGTQIAGINRRLGNDVRLALQTSGAGDGHRLAGCLATGTHGSALGIGAVHDTVLGLYLVVGPDRAVFVQSGSAPSCDGAIAEWLQNLTGIPTENRADDELFSAALVSLGSFGIVLGVVIEMVPLYKLRFKRFARAWNDQEVWDAIATLDTSKLHPETAEAPYHFDVVMHPYPTTGGDPGLFSTLMWKTDDETAATSPLPAIPLASSDLMSVISRLSQSLGSALAAPLGLPILRSFISQQLVANAATPSGAAFPGEMFGPTSLPQGMGASTEIVVEHSFAHRALTTVYKILDEEQKQGRFLLGVIGVRFVPQTKALLGMNIAKMNCYIELPSVRNDNVLSIYQRIWDGLDDADVPYTCHWGQLHAMTPDRLARYFGGRADAWKKARAKLLDPIARQVFGAPILAEVGLDT
jgi:hypothetical protein